MKKYKYRKHEWFNQKTGSVFYGIQAKEVGTRKPWMHCTDGPTVLLYADEAACDQKLEQLRRKETGAAAPAPEHSTTERTDRHE